MKDGKFDHRTKNIGNRTQREQTKIAGLTLPSSVSNQLS
jgi:hypothetical protein